MTTPQAPAAPSTASRPAKFRANTQATLGVGGSQTQTVALTTATQPLTTFFLPPNNVVRGIAIEAVHHGALRNQLPRDAQANAARRAGDHRAQV